jgi:hypothetical protein
MLTIEEFRAAGVALFGPGWQTRMAERFHVSVRTVRRWASGERPLPERIEQAFLALVNPEAFERSAPEWVIGSGAAGASLYIVHCHAPRFVARVDDDESLMNGFAWITQAGQQIGEIVWFDVPPPDHELRPLMVEAEAALDCRAVYEHNEAAERSEQQERDWMDEMEERREKMQRDRKAEHNPD